MFITLVCVGGPFDGKQMPRPDDGGELVIPNFLLKHSEVFETVSEEVLESDDEQSADPNFIGNVIAAHAHELADYSTSSSLYKVEAESLVFVRTLSQTEWREWKARQPRED